jgi:GDP-L-fucose synthase
MKILITGGTSMVGKHLKKYLPNAIYLSSKDCDLFDSKKTRELILDTKPNKVVHLAAKVGGIMDNISNPVGFFEDNIFMNTNVLKYSYEAKVDQFIGILSTCIYPDQVSDNLYPMKEDLLHLGPPTPTNFSYGYAKRCLAVQIDAYNKQFNTSYNYLTPCNLYSEHDHFEGNKAHFLSSLIHKIYQAKINNTKEINLMGSGSPLRQFMYADDLARVIHLFIENNIIENCNVCTDEVKTIKEIAEIALKSCDASDINLVWDTTKPDGQYRKDASSDKLLNIFKDFKFTFLENGIKNTYNQYVEAKRV